MEFSSAKDKPQRWTIISKEHPHSEFMSKNYLSCKYRTLDSHLWMGFLALGGRSCSRKEVRQDRDYRFCHRLSVQHVHRTHRKIDRMVLVCKPEPQEMAVEACTGHVGVADHPL